MEEKYSAFKRNDMLKRVVNRNCKTNMMPIASQGFYIEFFKETDAAKGFSYEIGIFERKFGSRNSSS